MCVFHYQQTQDQKARYLRCLFLRIFLYREAHFASVPALVEMPEHCCKQAILTQKKVAELPTR
jgi:hypothetical protein